MLLKPVAEEIVAEAARMTTNLMAAAAVRRFASVVLILAVQRATAAAKPRMCFL
jgi:hypothetical protein